MSKSRREVHRLRMALLVGMLGILTVAIGGCQDTKPPGPVTGFTATPGDAQVVLAWANPTDADRVKILRKVGAFPASSTDGTPGSWVNVYAAYRKAILMRARIGMPTTAVGSWTRYE